MQNYPFFFFKIVKCSTFKVLHVMSIYQNADSGLILSGHITISK